MGKPEGKLTEKEERDNWLRIQARSCITPKNKKTRAPRKPCFMDFFRAFFPCLVFFLSAARRSSAYGPAFPRYACAPKVLRHSHFV